MKALVVSTHFPTDLERSVGGTFKRMRIFLNALQEKASIRLLIYLNSDLNIDARRTAEAKAFLQSAWELEDLERATCWARA